jgi:hypothetical protein
VVWPAASPRRKDGMACELNKLADPSRPSRSVT